MDFGPRRPLQWIDPPARRDLAVVAFARLPPELQPGGGLRRVLEHYLRAGGPAGRSALNEVLEDIRARGTRVRW